MLTTYFIIGIVGLLLAIGMAVFDGVFDLDVGPDGAFSGTTFAATLAGFGFGGAIAISLLEIESTGGVLAFATLIGAVGWGISFGAYRLLHRTTVDDSGSGSVATLVGKEGSVTMAPASTSEWGELVVPFRGQRHTMSFLCETEVTTGQSVTIDAVVSSTRVRVSAIS